MHYEREQRLYRLEVTYPEAAMIEREGHFPDADADDIYYGLDPEWEPAGWAPTAEWVQRFKTTAFFWPNSRKLYLSRSGARARAQLLESYGATVVIRRTEPVKWEYSEAEVLEERVADLEEELALLRNQVAA
jgi:hypothetical protein